MQAKRLENQQQRLKALESKAAWDRLISKQNLLVCSNNLKKKSEIQKIHNTRSIRNRLAKMRDKRAQIISQQSILLQSSTKLRNSHNRQRILMEQKKLKVQSKWWKAKRQNQTRKAYHLDSPQVTRNRCSYCKTTAKAKQAKILSLNSRSTATKKERPLLFLYQGRIHKMLRPKIPVILAVLDPNTTRTMCSKRGEEVLIRCRRKKQILATSNTHQLIQEGQTAQKSNNQILYQERRNQDMQARPSVKSFTALGSRRGHLSIKEQDRVYSHLMLALRGTF